MGATMNKKRAKNRAWRQAQKNPFGRNLIVFAPKTEGRKLAKKLRTAPPQRNVFTVKPLWPLRSDVSNCDCDMCQRARGLKNPALAGKLKSSYLAFENGLIRKGFTRLGAGAYSVVYAKGDSDRVIKITRRADNWIDYCKWAAEEGYAGTFAPRVFSYKKIGSYSVAVVERCSTLQRDVDRKAPEAVVSGLVPYALKNNETAKLLLDLVQPKLPEFLDAFNKRFPKGQDLHGGNIMFRKDGSMCYTDPVCGDSNITSRRLKARDFTPSSLYWRFNWKLLQT